ncbi:unnamed protein product [Effrenium voratum]|uniref:Uncharacterized protein n=1 Tax=Effrenium voratum TaxID=2562239 RepID=A0AA36NAQ3_9DINO|nr:unnamed protein product [Effrenium voratum]
MAGEEKQLDEQETEAKEAVTAAAQRVQEAMDREDVVLEKLKAAKMAKAEAAAHTHKAAAGRGDVEKTVKVLELHMEGNQKVLELERKKKEAQEAAEAAKKAAEDAKKLEKQLAEDTDERIFTHRHPRLQESKAALAEQKVKASETLRPARAMEGFSERVLFACE